MLHGQTNCESSQNPPEIEVQCQGADRDVGWVIGSQLATKISRAEKELMELEAFRLSQPWWMPSPFYQYLAQWRARWLLEPNVRQAYPNMLERLQGIASGSHTTLDFLFLFHAMESAATTSQQLESDKPVDIDPAFAACTALAVTGERAKSRQPMLAHNFDLVESAGPLLSLRDCTVGGQYRYLGFSLAPMAGIIDGINEHGLAISYNYAPTVDLQLGNPPVSFAIEHLLGHCKTVQEAIVLASQLPRSGGALLMLADANGEIASLEISAQYQQARYSPTTEALFHSNAYQTALMQQHELPRNSFYSPQAPAALRNRRVFQSAEARENRMSELLERYGAIDEEALADIMSDHGCETSDGERVQAAVDSSVEHSNAAAATEPRGEITDFATAFLEYIMQCGGGDWGASGDRFAGEQTPSPSLSPDTRDAAAEQGDEIERASRADEANAADAAQDSGQASGLHRGSADSICMHGEYWSTMASVQLFPRERRLRISYGSPCRAKFGNFQL